MYNRPITMSWKPVSLPAARSPYTITKLAQNGTPSEFLSNPMMTTGIDLLAAATTGYLAWESSKKNGDLLPVWIMFSVAMGVKALHDFSRVKW